MKVSIKDLSEDDRPREKLMKYGTDAKNYARQRRQPAKPCCQKP